MIYSNIAIRPLAMLLKIFKLNYFILIDIFWLPVDNTFLDFTIFFLRISDSVYDTN